MRFSNLDWMVRETQKMLNRSSEIVRIRTATDQDRVEIGRVYSSAFPKRERDVVAKVAIALLSEAATPPTISLLAGCDDAVVGHIAFSPVQIVDHPYCRAYLLAPLAVLPEYQKRGIGSRLIEIGMRQLQAMRVGVVFVYGDPGYYGRFGFRSDPARRFTPPYGLQYPFGWQAIVFKGCPVARFPVTIHCVDPLCDPKFW